MSRYLVMLALPFFIIGCVQNQSPRVVVSAEDKAEVRTPLICEGKDQCDLFWQRAQLWLAKNSAWKIQSATEFVINTYYPSRRDVTWGFQVTREPAEVEGQQRIVLQPICRLPAAECVPDRIQVLASFKRYVRTGQ